MVTVLRFAWFLILGRKKKALQLQLYQQLAIASFFPFLRCICIFYYMLRKYVSGPPHMHAYIVFSLQIEALLHHSHLDEAADALEPIFAYFRRGDHKARPDADPSGRTAESPGADVNGVRVSFLDRFSLPWIRTMIATAGVSLLEKKKDYKGATEILRALLGGWCCPGRRVGPCTFFQILEVNPCSKSMSVFFFVCLLVSYVNEKYRFSNDKYVCLWPIPM